MGVAQKRALGVTVGLLVAGKVPDDQRLVATAREQHVGAIKKRFQSEPLSIFNQQKTCIQQIYENTHEVVCRSIYPFHPCANHR